MSTRKQKVLTYEAVYGCAKKEIDRAREKWRREKLLGEKQDRRGKWT